MMYRFLVGLLILDALILAAAVLLQSGKGGGLAASFGGAGSSPNSLLGSREAGNLLTKASWWTGGMFLGLAFMLSIMTAKSRGQARSVLDPLTQQQQALPPSSVPVQGSSQSAPLVPITPPAGTAKQVPPAKEPPPGKKPPEKQPPSGRQ